MGSQEHAGGTVTGLDRFRDSLAFELDPFQFEACRALEAGQGVLVAAPTGSGKTIVGEFAAFLALERGRKIFYTTPIKALSNQKFSDLQGVFGNGRVGLMTGDISINPEADAVVMTTEVLRNMLYLGSPALAGLEYVVMDEVHYLADRARGGVWEEVIIHLPPDVRLVSLSATVSNAEEFGAWLDTVRGDTAVVVSEHRPVPVRQHLMAGTELLDLFGTELAGTAAGAVQGDGQQERGRTRSFEREWGRRPVRRQGRAWWPQIIRGLDRNGLLPAISFIFSRAGCEAAVQECAGSGLWLTTPGQRREIVRRADEAVHGIPEGDLQVLGFAAWRDALRRGFAAHHAGMVFVFRETVENLFAEGLVRAVFATETLALGINMPARSVVLEALEKFDGESRVPLTAGEYTQLTGRAGRRGIDTEGHAVVLWRAGMDPTAVARLASERTYPLLSSFRPTYNMAINLLAEFGRTGAMELLEMSFAQFQADRSVVELARQLRQREEQLAGCGDFPQGSGQWWKLRAETDELRSRIEGSTSDLARTFDRLCGVLRHYGYLHDRDGELLPGPEGDRLRRIYGERDLLVSLGIGEGVLDGLDPAELAALASALVYRARGAERGGRPRMPTRLLGTATEAVIEQWEQLRNEEEARGLVPTVPPQLDVLPAMYEWASGGSLEVTLQETELGAGDFIHWTKRTVDLLNQLVKGTPMPPGLSGTCGQAITSIRRGAVVDQASQRP